MAKLNEEAILIGIEGFEELSKRLSNEGKLSAHTVLGILGAAAENMFRNEEDNMKKAKHSIDGIIEMALLSAKEIKDEV